MVPPQTGGAQLQLAIRPFGLSRSLMISTDSLRDRRTESKSLFAIFEPTLPSLCMFLSFLFISLHSICAFFALLAHPLIVFMTLFGPGLRRASTRGEFRGRLGTQGLHVPGVAESSFNLSELAPPIFDSFARWHRSRNPSVTR